MSVDFWAPKGSSTNQLLHRALHACTARCSVSDVRRSDLNRFQLIVALTFELSAFSQCKVLSAGMSSSLSLPHQSPEMQAVARQQLSTSRHAQIAAPNKLLRNSVRAMATADMSRWAWQVPGAV